MLLGYYALDPCINSTCLDTVWVPLKKNSVCDRKYKTLNFSGESLFFNMCLCFKRRCVSFIYMAVDTSFLVQVSFLPARTV